MSWLDKLSSKLGGRKQQAGAAAPPEPEALAQGGTVVRRGRLPAHTIKQSRERIKPGDVLAGNLEIQRLLGRGGMGEVWLARQTQWGADVAVKIPNDEILADPENRHRIAREAEAWTEIGLHPNIAYCHYAQPLDELLLLVIEYINGGNLRDWIADGRCVDLKTGLNLAIQFCHGLERAHSRGLVHRDIKPENVLLTKEGTVKITDFGIVHRAGACEAKGATSAEDAPKAVAAGMTMVAIGTDEYMAPEQWGLQEAIDHRADIFAFGVCLYEMFCGQRPYAITAGAPQEAPEPAQVRQDGRFPARLSELMKRCVDWDCEQRPKDARTMRAELCAVYEKVLGDPNPLAELPELVTLADDWNNRALSYLALGKEGEAEQAWQTALQADARHPESTYNYGLVQWRKGKMTDDRLLLTLRSVAESAPSAWLPRYLMAQVHLERGDAEGAKEALGKIPQDEGSKTELDAAEQAAEGLSAPNRLMRTFEGHTGRVKSVSLTPDGRRALSGSSDNSLKLWDVANGCCLRTFEGHWHDVNSVSLSADGRYGLSGSRDKTLKLWDMKSGRCLRTFEVHSSDVNSVSLSADGRYALSGISYNRLRSHDVTPDDHELKLWEVKSGRCPRTFDSGLCGFVSSVSLSADGLYALSGINNTLKLWEVESGRCLRTLEGHTELVMSVSLSADGRYALSGSRDKTMKLWELETSSSLRTFEGHTEPIESVSLSADGRYALSGSWDKTLKLWDVGSGRCLRTFEGHDGYAASVSADGRYALSGSHDKTMKLFELEGGRARYQATHRLSRGTETAQAVESSIRYHEALREARLAAESGQDVAVCRWLRIARQQRGQSRTPAAVCDWGRLYTRLRMRGLSDIWCCRANAEMGRGTSFMSFSANGRYALSESTNTLKLWEVESGRCLRTFEEHTNGFASVTLSADGRYALSGDWFDAMVKLWEVESGCCLRTLEGHTKIVEAASVSADGRYAISGSWDKTLKLWDVGSGRCLRTFEGHSGPVKSVGLSADGRYAISGSWDKTLKLWDVGSGRCLRTFEGHSGSVRSVRLSADGRYALSGSEDKTLKLWEVESGRCLCTLEGHSDSVYSVNLSADGRYALSGSGDWTLKVWEVESGRCLRTVELASPVRDSFVSADWQYVLVYSRDGLSRWFLDWDLEENQPAGWDERARPHLAIFLRAHQPCAAELPRDREPTTEEVALTLTHRGRPVWTEQDFQNLLYSLGCAGYGWLRPEGVRRELERMTVEWNDEE